MFTGTRSAFALLSSGMPTAPECSAIRDYRSGCVTKESLYFYEERFGGFADASCLMIDKVLSEPVLR